jgi:hypothetical protein
MDDVMVEYLKQMEFGELQIFGEMAVLPVFNGEMGAVEYITLQEAMIKEQLKITEVNDSGAVPELKVCNNADVPVLILDGEELMGAKQNRVVNTTILLRENFDTIIPVSCVEQGRWSYTSKNFQDSDRLASYKVRNIKSASVKRSVEATGNYNSDQGAVWDEVNNLQAKMECHSPTMAMGDVYEAKTTELKDYINAFELLEGQKGLLVFINGKVAGLDVISSSSAYSDLHQKLVKSYALDAMVQREDNQSKIDLNVEMASDFIDDILKSEESKNKSVGYGTDHRFASASYIGSSLVYEDRVVHASFFKSLNIGDEDVGGMARYSTRANLRQY